MNGYSRADEIAIGIQGAANRCGIPHSGCGESPVFVFSAGRGSGADELANALAATITVADEVAIPPVAVDALARQLIGAGFAADAPTVGIRPSVGASRLIDDVVRAQIRFYKEICSAVAGRARTERWGLLQYDLQGEYAVYLRFLFPAARCLFVRRNPADAYRSVLAQPATPFSHNEALADSFRAHCAELASSFERWRSAVDALVVDYERLPGEGADEVEEFLGLRLPEDARALWRSRESGGQLPAAVGAPVRDPHIPAGRPRDQAIEKNDSAIPTARVAEGGARGGSGSCAVLVPISRYIEPECEESLRALERHGYVVRRLYGCPAIDAARNILATRALDEGFEETLWVDSDVVFDVETVDQLRSHNLPIICGICAKKGVREVAA